MGRSPGALFGGYFAQEDREPRYDKKHRQYHYPDLLEATMTTILLAYRDMSLLWRDSSLSFLGLVWRESPADWPGSMPPARATGKILRVFLPIACL